MRFQCIILYGLTAVLCCVIPASLFAEKPVFQLGVSTTQYLPPPMYGTWQVKATLLSTNNPTFFPPTSEDIWTLAQDGSTVTLTNPTTGASATINVDQVQGNTARFRHVVKGGSRKLFEENPTVTVQGDRLSGQTRNQLMTTSRNGEILDTKIAVYRLEAFRIGGSRVQFQPPAPEPDEFQIDPIQPGRIK